jgi:hypothetical protein
MKVRNAFRLFITRARVHPDPNRLFEQAEALYNNSKDETDLRRAASAAYYALFHYLLTAASDLTIGNANRNTPRYNLAYRSIDHARLKTVCSQLKASRLSDEIQPYEPMGGFGPITDCAKLTLNLQEERIWADYDPIKHFDAARAQQAISDARAAITAFEAASVTQREVLLTLLLFKPRQP